MARPIQRIEREIAELEMAIASLAEEFYHAYCNYTQNLGQAVRQQLILASYHICTQSYPEEFIELSLTGRQNLQESFKKLAKQAETEINQAVSRPIKPAETLLSDEEVSSDSEDEEMATESPLSLVESDGDRPLINNPQDLAQWQQTLENEIVEILERFSRQANQCLKTARIFTEELPEPLIEIAKQATSSQEILAVRLPNILNLTIEAETFLHPHRKGDSKGGIKLPERLLKQHKESGTALVIGLEKANYDGEEDEEEEENGLSMLPFSLPLKIVLINLRLSDIEFNDPNVTAERKQLRHLQERFYKQQQDYQRKEKEYAIAQAEAAWRSSWIDDNP